MGQADLDHLLGIKSVAWGIRPAEPLTELEVPPLQLPLRGFSP